MPIISTIGRKNIKIRFLIIGIYTILILGAITMVYPFIIMVSTSFTSNLDMHEFRAIPRYFYDDEILFQKYIEAKYNEDVLIFNKLFNLDIIDFSELKIPKQISHKLIDDWQNFLKGVPYNYKMLGFRDSFGGTSPEVLYRYRKFLEWKFDGSIEKLNVAYKERQGNWFEIVRFKVMPFESWYMRFQPRDNLKYQDFLEFRKVQPERFFSAICMDGFYRYNLFAKYGRSIDSYNKTHKTNYKSYFEVSIKKKKPSNPKEVEEWGDFVRNELPFQFIKLEEKAKISYQSFLARKYSKIGGIKSLNDDYQTKYISFNEIQLPTEVPNGTFVFTHWREFIEKEVSIEYIKINTVEITYKEYLQKLYSDINTLNKAYQTNYVSFDEIFPSLFEAEYSMFKKDKNAIKFEFMWKNYREAIDYIILHGRALINTVILCIGMIFITLVVNSLCAYALSKFNLRSTYKILLFLLATMAFPAEVAMIPGFLLIKNLGLLNTYWAILLPATVNGFSIFLLKGFFDSLPKEYYDACSIDGASEMKIFWHITLPLSKPVLAVIGLGAFTAAYGSFMWVLLVCQDDKMWTLMVWLYQLQFHTPQFVMFAALVVAAIPTLIVFIFSQRVIMRGVILPVET